jgi:hypothetical protein
VDHGFKFQRTQHLLDDIGRPLLSSGAMPDNDKRDAAESANRRQSLIALGFVILLFVIGWLLTRELYSNQKVEDCILSGGTNCAPIQAPATY